MLRLQLVTEGMKLGKILRYTSLLLNAHSVAHTIVERAMQNETGEGGNTHVGAEICSTLLQDPLKLGIIFITPSAVR